MQVCDDLVQLVKHIKSGMGAIAEHYGLTHMQLYVMNTIQAGGAITMGTVAHSLHCDASNITGIIDRLVTQGLVTRQEDEHDRRAKMLQLTDKGVKMMDDIVAALPKQLGCDKLTVADRQKLHSLIAQLV